MYTRRKFSIKFANSPDEYSILDVVQIGTGAAALSRSKIYLSWTNFFPKEISVNLDITVARGHYKKNSTTLERSISDPLFDLTWNNPMIDAVKQKRISVRFLWRSCIMTTLQPELSPWSAEHIAAAQQPGLTFLSVTLIKNEGRWHARRSVNSPVLWPV